MATRVQFLQATSPGDIPPVIATPHHFLISIFRNNIYFVSVVLQEGKDLGYHLYSAYILSHLFVVPPLLVVEFLHRIMDIFTEYFSECTEQRIKEHYVTVYEVNLVCICVFYKGCLDICFPNRLLLTMHSNLIGLVIYRNWPKCQISSSDTTIVMIYDIS